MPGFIGGEAHLPFNIMDKIGRENLQKCVNKWMNNKERKKILKISEIKKKTVKEWGRGK